MTDPLIRRPLPRGWIDLVVGEAMTTRLALGQTFGAALFDDVGPVMDCDYSPPEGWPPLIELLERKHEAPVVVTAGAKQALCACFYAAKKLGMRAVAMSSPYWAQMPAAIEACGLEVIISDEPVPGAAYLLVSPNNPDGRITPPETMLELEARCRELGTILIHDGAYHTETYIGGPAPDVTSISIRSVAKAYGLSGLRIGYVISLNPDVTKAVCDYVETTTVGVSKLSQQMLCRVLELESQPNVQEGFISTSQRYLRDAKILASLIRPDVLDTTGITETAGMFGWFKTGPKFDPDAARLLVAPGVAFGDSTRVRVNLGVSPGYLREAVTRLNTLR